MKQQKITFKQSKFSPLWIIGFIGITGISLPAFSQTPVQASIEQTPIHHLDNKKNDNTSKTKRTIKGKVISSYFNEIQPLPGTSILLKGFRTGTNADLDGNFELEVPDSVTSQKLILSLTFIGYKPKEITIYDTQ
ncbi:hypothetical protein FHS59_002780 [Algoriphagus iocasae]|uniref:CarboxypepD_reg-like domain-containing protein n=1 Tax=Algoriphagus iocasae TaxID=1836499 RepID=A0A841MG56_9BACT|nr:carboxypeptidase-like regulatory domain-containing protein [Algoriphagus iocasae]MBB6327152.1 hypothetical protein [Algoriphagus iocasae]